MNFRDDSGISLEMATCLWMSLGQVHKLHGCMTENFHPVSQAPGIGMPLPFEQRYLSMHQTSKTSKTTTRSRSMI